MGKVRTCGGRCHNAKGTRCRCWCGGAFHGSAGAANRETLVNNITESDQAQLLEQHGFKKGETKYTEQKKLPIPV